jgi:hypothetical protein
MTEIQGKRRNQREFTPRQCVALEQRIVAKMQREK